MARICIVTPGQVGSNPRVVKEAAALVAAGHDVQVMATKVSDFLESRDQSVLVEASHEIERIAFDGRTEWRMERIRQIIGRGLFAVVPLLSTAERAISPVARRLVRSTMASAADLYIAHYVAALPAAAHAAQEHGAIYAFDGEDFHLGDLPDASQHALDKRLIRIIEGRYLPGAAYVSAASPMIADAYADAYAISRPAVVLNVFPKANAPAAPTPRGSARPGPSLYWFSQTIGPGRGLETAIEAIKRAESRPHLYLRGRPAAGYEDSLRALALAAGVADRLHVLDPALPKELEKLGGTYDLGYVGETSDTYNRQIAITNKLFSYLLGGVPSVVSDIPAHRDIASQLGAALTLFPSGNATALAIAMDALLLDPHLLAVARAHAWRLGQERFNWEVERGSFLDAVDRAIARRKDEA